MNEKLERNYQILIADDDPDNLRLLHNLLREQGYQIRPALSGEKALAFVQITQPDLILLDILMVSFQ